MNAKRAMTATAVFVLTVLGVFYTIQGSELKWDALISLIGILVFWKLYDRMHQDLWSYGAFLLLLLAHTGNVYLIQVPLVHSDTLLHLYGGFALAMIALRLFKNERWPLGQKAAMIVLFVMGLGAIHEIVEFVGFVSFGEGDGFLFFGLGDEGEWRDAMLDLLADLFGALTVLGHVWSKHR